MKAALAWIARWARFRALTRSEEKSIGKRAYWPRPGPRINAFRTVPATGVGSLPTLAKIYCVWKCVDFTQKLLVRCQVGFMYTLQSLSPTHSVCLLFGQLIVRFMGLRRFLTARWHCTRSSLDLLPAFDVLTSWWSQLADLAGLSPKVLKAQDRAYSHSVRRLSNKWCKWEISTGKLSDRRLLKITLGSQAHGNNSLMKKIMINCSLICRKLCKMLKPKPKQKGKVVRENHEFVTLYWCFQGKIYGNSTHSHSLSILFSNFLVISLLFCSVHTGKVKKQL